MQGIGGKTAFTDDIDACVAKGGNGVEKGDPNAPCAKGGEKHRQIQQRARALHQKRARQHAPHKAVEIRKRMQIEGVADQVAVPQAKLAVQGGHNARHDRDDAKTTDLDQQQDHHLPKHAPGGGGGKRDQPRDAGSGGGGKQRVNIGNARPRSCADGQRQQQTACQNGQKKAEQDHLRSGK